MKNLGQYLLILLVVIMTGCKAGGGGPIQLGESGGTSGGGSDRDDGAISEQGVKLAFSVQPTSTFQNSNIQPGVGIKVLVQDAYGNTVNSSIPVTLAFSNDASAGGATLAGTLTQNAVAGVATFPDISIDTTANGYTFNATSTGLTSSISSAFNIFVNTSTQLVFTTDPSNATAGVNNSPSIVVEIQDPGFVTIPINTQVTLSFNNDASGGSATLSGTLTTTSINGIATFPDINIDKAAVGYTLRATTPSPLTDDISTAFNITPGAPTNLSLAVTGAANIDADGATTTTLQATLTDSFANPITGANTTLNIPGNGGTTANPAVTNGSGVANWTLTSSNTAGTYAYTATSTVTSNSVNVVFDPTILLVTVNQKGAQADPTAALPVEFDVVFSDPITAASFTTADITQNGTATGVTWNIINSGDNQNFTLQATATTSSGTIVPSIANNLVTTPNAILNNTSTSTDNSVTYIPAFAVTVNQKGAQADPTAGTPVEYDVVFGEAVNAATFTTADITQNGSATGITWNIINSGDNINFTLQATAITGDGTVIPSIGASTVQTTLGANNSASSATDNNVLYRTKINVTVNQKGGNPDPDLTLPAEFDVVFSEPITAATFTTADITQSGSATGVTWNIINSGDNINFTLQATATTSSGTLIPSIANALVSTSYSATNNPSTSGDNSITYAPAYNVTINQKGAQADPTALTPVEYDVVFSEAISPATFTTADITQNGTATGITWNIINSGDNINFTLQATAITGDGTVIPSINASLITSAFGGNNNASTSTDNSVNYKTTIDVTVNQNGGQQDPTSSTPVVFDVVFSEAINPATFTTADITQNGT
ncbi:MAG: Ig-like domain-containing protein, partial [Bacteriovoracaceae bacterium]|nr:Ig-like domain-containing protein [Bacteriovoracaceae bacterium]